MPENELIHTMDEREYRSAHGVAKSDLDKFVNPGKKFPVLAGHQGTATHSWLLEGIDAVKAQYATADRKFHRSSKEDADYRAELQAAHPGKFIFKPEETADITRWREAILANKRIADVIEADGENEVSCFATLDGFDLLSKCRIDMVRDKCLIDLKTTSAADEAEFLDSICRYGYNAQAAYYRAIYHAITGLWKPFVFVCVSKLTYHSWIVPLTNEQLAFGDKWFENVLSLYQQYGVKPDVNE